MKYNQFASLFSDTQTMPGRIEIFEYVVYFILATRQIGCDMEFAA